MRGLNPVPGSNPTDVIQRSEMVLLLMEWASSEGTLAAGMGIPPEQEARLRESFLRVLADNGVGDPGGTLRAVRLQALENQKNEPHRSSHFWWNRALLQEASSDFLGKVDHFFDNTMFRVSQAFKLKANSIACIISFLVAFSIQLDSLALLRRLSMDDGMRQALVAEAGSLVDRVAKAEEKAKAAEAGNDTEEELLARQDAEKARAARDEVDATLALLREPRFAIIPDALSWERLAQGTVCPGRGAAWTGTLRAGGSTYSLAARPGLSVDTLENALIDSGAPVFVYRVRSGEAACLRIVARKPTNDPGSLGLDTTAGPGLRLDVTLERDREGARRRFPGVLLSAVLLSLGTPFWFNLLKRVLSLRSGLAQKDDKERQERESQQAPPAPPPAGPAGSREKTAKPGDGEMGDLNATGAVG
jgi:hypothetical protein